MAVVGGVGIVVGATWWWGGGQSKMLPQLLRRSNGYKHANKQAFEHVVVFSWKPVIFTSHFSMNLF